MLRRPNVIEIGNYLNSIEDQTPLKSVFSSGEYAAEPPMLVDHLDVISLLKPSV